MTGVGPSNPTRHIQGAKPYISHPTLTKRGIVRYIIFFLALTSEILIVVPNFSINSNWCCSDASTKPKLNVELVALHPCLIKLDCKDVVLDA